MRPLKITMTAFGPYKNCEVIDFTELKNNRLFVVSGNTGAGKTTIFDAICFALYGSASGEDRSEPKYMRSDFAEEDVHTSVELEFELHHHYYRIKRQLPHVKKGNKSATGESYEFYEKVDGREVPCVDRQIVSEINKKVEALVGLSKDQFSQIVMLPQGEFRKLLTSQTENKEEILRKIFKTEPYRWIIERLKEKKKLADDDYKREALTRDRYIKDIEATLPERENSLLFEILSQQYTNTNQVVNGLDEEIVFYQNEMVKNKEQEEVAGFAYNQKLEAFHKAEELNEKFKNFEEKERILTDLSQQIPIFKEKEKQFANADRASRIEPYEKQVNEMRDDLRMTARKLADAEGKQTAAINQLESAQKVYEIEESKKTDREKVGKTLDRYNEFLPIVKEIDSKQVNLLANREEVLKLAKDLEDLQSKIKDEKLIKVQLGNDIKVMETAVNQLVDKQQRLTEMREQVRVLQDYLVLNKKQAELEIEFKTNEAVYREMKKRYEILEEAWVNGQASILATHLHDGKPCPVCGSSEHPNKAQGQDNVPTKDELEAVKRELDIKDNAFRDTVAKFNTNKEQLEMKAAEVTDMGVLIQDVQHAFNHLVDEGKGMKKEVELLEKEKVTLDKLKAELEKTEKKIEQFEAKQGDMAKAYQEQNTAFETKKAVYEAEVSRIPEEIRVLAVLERKITEIQALKTKMEQAWEMAQNQLHLAKEADTKATANVINAKNLFEESSGKKEKSEKQFLDALNQANFLTEDAYHQAKMDEKDRQQLRETIDDFHTSLETLKTQVKELQESLNGKDKVDIEVLKSECDEYKAAYVLAQDQVRNSEQCLKQTKELKGKILDAEKSAAELEKRLNVIADLYDVLRGQNSSKVSFERYLQIEYLEQIIIAANERLKHLSNGQFLLERSERQESRGKQSGLGLDVFDAYTGQTRDVKTLSGGEKFNASLCLALGMADVIQSFQGGVSIDTMFIDEGFGSLDEESLNKAIDTLVDLQQSGRMIGVISHVQELKNVFPAILEVKKTKEGYSQTEFVVK